MAMLAVVTKYEGQRDVISSPAADDYFAVPQHFDGAFDGDDDDSRRASPDAGPPRAIFTMVYG